MLKVRLHSIRNFLVAIILSVLSVLTVASISSATDTVLVGQGLNSPPSVGCDVQQPSVGFALANLQRPQVTERVIDIGLDRQSFIDRGWSDSDLGRWNNGSFRERKGLFLSMFYALQMGNDNDIKHPWNETIHSWDRGIGAHIDYYLKERHKKQFNLYVYDNVNAPTKRGLVVGRDSTESPFNAGVCKGENIIGCAGSDDNIYIKTDYRAYVLGRRLDEPPSIQINGKYYTNITHLIAHETGHFFGMPHVSTNDTDAIMNPTIGASNSQRWHDQSLEQQALFRALADQLNT
jgi:hypothetical protein